jgi:hypothetical protein
MIPDGFGARSSLQFVHVLILYKPSTQEMAMDNRINELRRKISALRLDMLDIEVSIRAQVNNDLDCSESAARLMAMRRELTALVKRWTFFGGGERLPTITERLRENYRPVMKPKTVTKPKIQRTVRRMG